MRVLALNAGSSTLKLSVLGDGETPLAARTLELPDGRVRPGEVAEALAEMPDADVAGHRGVHGGGATAPAVVDDTGCEHIAALTGN
mgnify:CR=1 FL=1